MLMKRRSGLGPERRPSCLALPVDASTLPKICEMVTCVFPVTRFTRTAAMDCRQFYQRRPGG